MISQRKGLLAVADLTWLAGAIFASAVTRFGWRSGTTYVENRAGAFLVLLAFAPPVFYVCGLYSMRRLRSAVAAFFPAVGAIALLLLASVTWWYLTSSLPVGRGIVVEFATLSLLGILAVRFAYKGARGLLDIRTLVVGPPRLAADVAALLQAHPDAPLRIAGMVVCPERDHRADAVAAGAAPPFPVIGELDAIEDVIATNRIDQIILPPRLREYPELLKRVRPLSYRGVSLVDFVSVYEEITHEVPIEHVDDDWLFAAASAPSQLHIRRVKRLTDVLASLLLLTVAAPILALAAVAVRLTSRGAVLFKQERVGFGSEPFMVLKLRTMDEDAEKHTGPVWSTEDDPRITPVGKFLRKFRIDELPQLWNVLRGDMSLVGPRPERPVFVKQLSDAIPHYAERLHVRPGITGWAQVLAPYAASVSDSARKLQFDLYYTKNLSLSLDLLILLLTAKTVLFGRERAQGGMTAGQQLSTAPALSGSAGDVGFSPPPA